MTHSFRYQPYYCEENAWWLCQEPSVAARYAVLISNPRRTVALLHQRAAAEGHAVVWDYHVVVVSGPTPWLVWDLDTRLALPIPAKEYLAHTFPVPEGAYEPLRPWFRVVDAAEYVHGLVSDRSHMRDRHGRWQAEPPPWPAPGAGAVTLQRYIDMAQPWQGQVMPLETLMERFG